jgi:hypothetical protein
LSKLKFRPPKPDSSKHFAPRSQPEDPDAIPPTFSLRFLRASYCVSKCTKEEKIAFVDTLPVLGQTPWKELRQMRRHAYGYEKLSRGAISEKPPSEMKPDADYIVFIVFRFQGKKPMVGFRDAYGVFHILWLDRNFTLYDHGS